MFSFCDKYSLDIEHIMHYDGWYSLDICNIETNENMILAVRGAFFSRSKNRKSKVCFCWIAVVDFISNQSTSWALMLIKNKVWIRLKSLRVIRHAGLSTIHSLLKCKSLTSHVIIKFKIKRLFCWIRPHKFVMELVGPKMSS